MRKALDRFKFWIGLLVSLIFLALVFWRTDFHGIGKALSEAHYVYLIPATIVYFVGVWLRAERWRHLLAPVKLLPARRLFPVVTVGYMANNVLPARIGELVRAYVLGRKESVSKTATLATIVVERIFDGITMLLFIAAASFLVDFPGRLQQIVRFAGILFAVVIVLFAVMVIFPSLTRGLGRLVGPLLPAKVRGQARDMGESFLDGLQSVRSGRRVTLVLLYSVAAWLCEAGMYYVVMYSFNFHIPFYAFVLVTAVVNLGTMVPSSPGYVGTFEGLSIWTLTIIFGVTSAVATSYTLVLHAALYLPITLVGVFFFWRQGTSWKTLTSGRMTTADAPSPAKD